jgi:predicted MFS family arabinose efflux permease
MQSASTSGVNRAVVVIGRYQWLTLMSGFLGWAFDTMDLSLFTLVMVPSVSSLIHSTDFGVVTKIGAIILAVKLVCWGIGGILFGVVADRFGRAKTMAVTILVYSGFTGLSALAQSWPQLALLQALAGFGIGGEWSAGAALIAETWPERYRPSAMQVMQMAFAIGFFLAALNNLLLGPISWRWVYAAGMLPGVVSLIVLYFVPEPERWLKVRDSASVEQGTTSVSKAWATFSSIFDTGLLRNTLVGVLTASAMMIGCWGGLALLPNWIQQLVRASGGTNGVHVVSYAFMLMMLGAAVGYLSLIWITEALGRRGAYFVFALGSLAASIYLFLFIADLPALLHFMPVYGYFTIGGFGTFALYLPELFPTRVRATGQGFCWNFARSVTAIGPLSIGALIAVFGSLPYAASASTAAYVIGLVAIWFGPETKGVPLVD